MRKFTGYEKGVNLGGWLSQCEHTKEHYDTFITESDFAELSKWNLDHVRIPVDYNLIESDDGNFIESGMAYIQKAVDWCEKYGLNMVLDLHKTAGYSFDNGEKESGFFDNPAMQERFYKLWEELAVRFGKYHKFVAFELLNEVTDISFSEKWNEISRKCIERIRKIAPDIYILIGSYNNNSIESIESLELPYDDKIVYNFHCYEPLVFTHQGAYWVENMPEDFRLTYPDTVGNYISHKRKLGLDIADPLENLNPQDTELFDSLFSKAAEIAEKRNVPLYCGEYGVINFADKDSTIAWYQAINKSFRKYGISHAAWCYKYKDFGITDTSFSNELKKYL